LCVQDSLADGKNWGDQEVMAELCKQKASLEKSIQKITRPYELLNYLTELVSLEDEALLSQAEPELGELEALSMELKLRTLFKDPSDSLNCYLEINAGTGGTDSQDLAQMLERMYLRYAAIAGFEASVIYRLSGEEAGIKQSLIEISGENAYGLLKNETGIHRFVRISPFNANAKRQTSFVSVLTSPVVDDNIKIEIKDSDLKIDTYRSSGAGGQHVNKTESAIRITHLPTGIVAACQDDRSQHRNREIAFKILYSKLYKMQQDIKRAEQNAVQKSDISWGNQIRNYVFAPYKLVKDLRSGFETSQIDKIMDGEISQILQSLLLGKE
jgi:peptide chain release factor 2